ncbi:MAG: hypothetical protein JNJ41_02450 [Bacteroidia bacterium]|nr:hypothetical protein [Bacteroidia bacterium]
MNYENTENYILPSIEIKESLQKDDKSRSFLYGGVSKFIQSFEELFTYNGLVIVGEPGNGKSRLLIEIANKAAENNRSAIFLDLKKLEGHSIEDKIIEHLSRNEAKLSYKPISDKAIYTPDFNLNTNDTNIIVCLDALDEVNNDDFYDCVALIKKFKHDFSNIKIIISCRDYVYKKYENLLQSLKLQLLEIKPFTLGNINRYLIQSGFSEDEIRKVLEKFRRDYNYEVINSPRILEIFVQGKKEGLDQLLNKNKAELLETFIYQKLKVEDKTARNNNELTKRVLEKLALTMEIYQTNEISKDELMTFFDDINSNLTSNFLNLVQIDEFYERSLLVPTFDGKSIQFQNVEFQEYLAAKEITRFERSDQALYDFAMDKNISELFNSWANVIQYLILLEPNNLNSIINYITKRGKSANSTLLERVLLSDKNLIKTLKKEDVESVFSNIFLMHQELNWYLRYDVISKLSLFYTPIAESLLKTSLHQYTKDIALENAIYLIEKFIDNDDFKDKTFWQAELLNIYKTNSSENVKRAVISALGSFKSLEIYKNNIKIEELNKNQLYDLTKGCINIDPNDIYTIELLINSVKNRGYNIYPMRSFEKVNSKEGIKYYLKAFLGDELLLSSFKVNPPDKYFFEDILENISNVYDEEIQNLLTEIILLPTSNAQVDRIIPDFIDLIKKKDSNYLSKLIEYFKNNGQLYIQHSYLYNLILLKFLTINNVEDFINEMLTIPDSRDRIIALFWHEFSFSADDEGKKIFEITKELFSAEYSQYQEQIDKYKLQQKKYPDIYEQFKYKLEPEPGKYSMDVFSYYSSNKKFIRENITETDEARMKYLLEDTVLKYDFRNANVTYKSVEKRQYTISNIIPTFDDALPLFTEFGVDIQKYRMKIIEYIPFAFANDRNKYAFSLLGDLSQDEMDYLYSFYTTERKDNTEDILVNNLFDICRNFSLLQFLPKLKQVVLDNKHEYYRRKEALDIINSLQPDAEFLQIVFDTYLNSTISDNEHILLTANEYLIGIPNPKRGAAIKWRMNKISLDPIEKEKENDEFETYDISHRHDDLPLPLGKISDLKFQDEFIAFFNEGIRICNLDQKYLPYAKFIWNTVIKYFDNLKIHRSYNPLENIKANILKNSDSKGYEFLYAALSRLKVAYADLLGKPLSFSESIKIYNSVKKKTYNNVNNAEDFYFIVEQIIDEDIKNWVVNEGAYNLIYELRDQEDLIQKTLKTQFWNGLLKRGLRDCDIRREEQLLDGKRTDFVINYGFIGQILIELKLCKNPDLTDPAYEKKLMQYIKGTNSDYGVFLVFQTTDTPTWVTQEPIVKSIYQKHLDSKQIRLKAFDCSTEVIIKKSIVKKKATTKGVSKKPVVKKKVSKKVPSKKTQIKKRSK